MADAEGQRGAEPRLEAGHHLRTPRVVPGDDRRQGAPAGVEGRTALGQAGDAHRRHPPPGVAEPVEHPAQRRHQRIDGHLGACGPSGERRVDRGCPTRRPVPVDQQRLDPAGPHVEAEQ